MGLFSFLKKEHKPSTAELLRKRQFSNKQDELIEHGFPKGEFMLSIDNILGTEENGTYITGKVQAGNLNVGDTLKYNGFKTFDVKEIKVGTAVVDDARKDEEITILLANCSSSEVEVGGVLKK